MASTSIRCFNLETATDTDAIPMDVINSLKIPSALNFSSFEMHFRPCETIKSVK